MEGDSLFKRIQLFLRGKSRGAIHFRFDAHDLSGIPQASFSFLPVGQIDVRRDQVILLVFLMIRLLAGRQYGAERDSQERRASRVKFHGRSPLRKIPARDRRKQETRSSWRRRVPQETQRATATVPKNRVRPFRRRRILETAPPAY